MIFKAPLKINGKLFCKCSKNNSCEICRGLPGSLPVLNIEAVKTATKFSIAAKCKLSKQLSFYRKIDGKKMLRYSSSIGTDGLFKDVGIQIKEVRISELPSGEAVLSISASSNCKPETTESIMKYLNILDGKVLQSDDKYPYDLPETLIAPTKIEREEFQIPEFSWKKISRWTKLGIDSEIASRLASDPLIADAFDANPSLDYARFFTVNLANALERNSVTFEESNISKQLLRSIFARMRSGEATEREAEELINELLLRPREGEIVLNRKVYKRIGDERQIKDGIDRVISENPSLIVDWRIGRQDFTKVMCKVMEEFQGRADPVVVRKMLEQRLVLKEV